MIVDYHKNIGESMTDIITRFRQTYNLTPDVKVSFAGRLDPMAFGIVRLLTHEDKQMSKDMCNFNKIYSYSVIQSLQTDTFDILGLITSNYTFHEKIYTMPNTIQQVYPAYSSKTVDVDGKKVRLWDANKRNLVFTETPTKEVTIYWNKKTKSDEIMTKQELIQMIYNKIDTVNGKFRQEEIKARWSIIPEDNYCISHYQTKISSGGYVRSIAHSMNGTAFDICRESYIE
jgi:tRNA U55 pseudouridine synthase TruB